MITSLASASNHLMLGRCAPAVRPRGLYRSDHLVSCQCGVRNAGEPTAVAQLPDGGHRVGVGEEFGIGVIGDSTSWIDHPPRGLQGDSVRVVEVDGVHESV